MTIGRFPGAASKAYTGCYNHPLFPGGRMVRRSWLFHAKHNHRMGIDSVGVSARPRHRHPLS